MNLIQFFSDNHAYLFFLLAGLGLVIELALIGLSGPLLFFAIASFITGILSAVGLIKGWEIELFTLGILTFVIALLLWKPLKRFQNKSEGKDTSSDMIGLTVPCVTAVSTMQGAIRYSGVNWRARLHESQTQEIPEGAACIICAVEGNVMVVKSKV